jgi:CRISPR/Cas system-associated exonuclease Cas4 (RecB family)
MSYAKTEQLIEKISEALNLSLRAKIKRYHRNNFIASDIHECDRYMVYSVLNWQDRPLHNEGLQALFDSGNKEERNVISRLLDLGIEIVHQQTPFEIRNRAGEKICTGQIDGAIRQERDIIPFEIKSMSPLIFAGIKGIESFQKKPHLRKYLRQMQLYLYGKEKEAGLFILSDFRQLKMLPVALDLGECEQIVGRLERLWECVKKKELPEKTCFHGLCDTCAFNHICLPDSDNDGAKIIDNAELEITLERYNELKPIAKEYEEVADLLKDTFTGISSALVGGNWQITGQERKRSAVNTKLLPDEIRKEYTEETTFWVSKFTKLGDKK